MILKDVSAISSIPQRIVSVVPSQTELLFSLGLEKETRGITKFCVHPQEWFNSKIRVGGTKALNLEKIREIAPDLILANYEENVKEQIEALAEDFPVWVTDVRTTEDALQMIRDTGFITGRGPQAESLITDIENAFSRWKADPRSDKGLKVAYLIWKDPFMTVGGDTFINSMLEMAGFRNVFAWRDRYPEVGISELKSAGCDLILLSSEPYPFSQKHAEQLSIELPGSRVILTDGEIFSWYGSRMLKAPAYFIQLWQSLKSVT